MVLRKSSLPNFPPIANVAPASAVPSQVPITAPPGKTRLITQAGDLEVLSGIQLTDARTAMCRGVQEYLQTLSTPWVGGRDLRFEKVLHTWAQSEDPAVYPSACVYAPGPGTYDASSYTSALKNVDIGPNQYLRKPCELMLDLIVEIYCTAPDERVAISAMMENALNPGDFMYGFLLELPHYFNTRAIYEPTSHEYADEAGDAKRRIRRLLIGITATMPVLQLRGFVAPIQVQTDLFVDRDD